MKRVGSFKTLALLAVMAIGGMAAERANASTVIFGAFTETGNPVLHYSNSTGQLLGTNVTALFNDAGSGVLGNFNGAVLFNLTATRTAGVAGNVTGTAPNVSQQVFGTITFKDAANTSSTVLSMTFSGAVLSGAANTGNINGSTLLGHAIAFSSDLQGTFTAPLSFSIALSTDAILALGANNNLADFNASAAGNFTENITGGGPQGAPLPAAVWGGMSLMGMLGGVGAWAKRRRR